MEFLEQVARYGVLLLYFAILVVLSVYGTHRWYLLHLYYRHRHDNLRPQRPLTALSRVTVQIPLFNEMYVARRVIDAVSRLDYPRELLEIQVLDDSTDETSTVVAREVRRHRERGVDIVHLHRTNRAGFKAGALAVGLRVAKGELVAVFDADFTPASDFLRRLVPHFADPGVGMVQARWGHLNSDHSALTRVQAMLLDGHFIVEHTARNRSGRFFNFNGTAGIWRKRCIEDAGGWQHDTLTEDLDLSYRAQLLGWRFVYVPEVVAPAELPVEMGAFKAQQHRWAKGSIQTARKLLPKILRSDQSFAVKSEAVFHMTANIAYVLMLALAVLVVPAVWLRRDIATWMIAAVDLPLFAMSSVSVVAFYITAHREARGTLRSTGRFVPFLMAVGIGLCVNNARAVIEALLGRASDFRRTPKYNLQPGESVGARRYRGRVSLDTAAEAALAIYFGAAVAMAIAHSLWGSLPFLLLFEIGFAYTAVITLVQSVHAVRPRPPVRATTA
ncbi:MAG: cellulose synthase family protein [Myxococcota bacterium]